MATLASLTQLANRIKNAVRRGENTPSIVGQWMLDAIEVITGIEAGELSTPLDTKGDLLGHDGTGLVRIPAGASGRALTPAAAADSGLAWTFSDALATEYSASSYTPSSATIGGQWAGIDTAIGALPSASYVDTQDDSHQAAAEAAAEAYTDDEINAHEGAADPHAAYVLAEGNGTVTDNALVRWDLTTGRLIQDGPLIADDAGNLSGVATQEISSAAPHLRFSETGVATDQGKWEFGVNGSTWTFRTLEDDNTPGLDILSVSRTSGTFANHLRVYIGLWSDANSPQIGWIDADHTSGEQRWRSIVANGQWRLEARNDSNSSGNAAMTVARTAQDVTDVQAKTRYGDVQLAPVYSVTEGETDMSIVTAINTPFDLLGSALNLGTIEDGYKYAFTIWIHVTPVAGVFYVNEDMDQEVVSFDAECRLIVVRRSGGNAQLTGVRYESFGDFYAVIPPAEAPPGELQDFFEALDLQVDLTSNVLTITPRVTVEFAPDEELLSVQVDASYVRTPAPAVPTEIE